MLQYNNDCVHKIIVIVIVIIVVRVYKITLKIKKVCYYQFNNYRKQHICYFIFTLTVFFGLVT